MKHKDKTCEPESKDEIICTLWQTAQVMQNVVREPKHYYLDSGNGITSSLKSLMNIQV